MRIFNVTLMNDNNIYEITEKDLHNKLQEFISSGKVITSCKEK